MFDDTQVGDANAFKHIDQICLIDFIVRMRRYLLYTLCCFIIPAISTSPGLLYRPNVSSSRRSLLKHPVPPVSTEVHSSACAKNYPAHLTVTQTISAA